MTRKKQPEVRRSYWGPPVCPVCKKELRAWFLLVREAPRLLGISPTELLKLIEDEKIDVRIMIDKLGRIYRYYVDLASLDPLPPAVHENFKHSDFKPFER